VNVSGFTRKAVEAGQEDPGEIAEDYLAKALASEDPRAWLRVPVRMAVGSAFSSLQKAFRGEQQNSGGQAGGDGTGVQKEDGSQQSDGSGSVILDLTRQSRTASRLWIPSTRTWILFADATVPQLEDAIRFYRGRRDAITRSIAELKTAIKHIRAVPGAVCLRDVWAAQEKSA
jgi:hypothetical protein